MAAKSSDWRPGPTVCRCCLAEGCYKDISTEYFWMGKREVYAEMLSETLNLSISYSKSGGPNSNSRLICEPCISRLRDASDFKRQVLECEKTFMHHLDPASSSMQKEIEESPEQVKIERVKQESKISDDEDDFEDRVDFIVENDDSDDDIDNQPLMKLASKVPKKEVDLLELLDSSQVTVKRKAAATSSAKAKEPPAKKAKKREIVIKPSASKATASAAPKTEKKKRADYDPSRSNAETILRCTTAHPFRVNDKAILCVYCHELYDDPDLFRAHMEQEHVNCTLKIVFHNLPKTEFIKADLTNLRCRMCSQSLDDLDAAAVHLATQHGQQIDSNGKLGVMPYKLRKDLFNCAVCDKNVPSLLHLNRHTISHFLSYVCHFCGSSYIATTGLLRHLRSKHQEYEVWCKTCRKKFPNMEAKERHRRTEKSCMPYSCQRCSERFLDWKSRQRHLEMKHGIAKKTFRCGDCNLDFTSDITYYSHFKLQHSDNCAVCKHCGMKFVSPYRLKRHLAKHNL